MSPGHALHSVTPHANTLQSAYKKRPDKLVLRQKIKAFKSPASTSSATPAYVERQ